MLPNYYLNDMSPKPQPSISFRQGAFGTKTEFEFLPDRLKFTLKTSSSVQSFFVAYRSININEITDYSVKNAWVLNAGLVWMVFGGAFFLMKTTLGLFWFAAGVLTYAGGLLTKKNYSRISADSCNLLVIRDRQHDEIIAALRAANLLYLRRYAGFYENESLVDATERFRFLLNAGAISQDEFIRLHTEASGRSHVAEDEGPPNLLN